MPRRAVPALQVALAAVLLALLVGQAVVLPAAAADSAERFPEAAFLRWPVLVLAVGTLGCAQAAVVCIGRWLSAWRRQDDVDPALDRYVDVFVAAVATASGLVMLIGAGVSATVGSPLWLPCAVVALLGGGLALLVSANADRLATLS
jgi:hypothetical protein